MSKILLALTVISALTIGASIYKLSNSSTQNQQYPEEIIAAWNEWKNIHRKDQVYASFLDDSYRLGVFNENYQRVQDSNSNPAHTFTLELNKFADMSPEEFKKTYLKHEHSETHEVSNTTEYEVDLESTGSVDWTTTDAVTGVKDQGQCGSCWAFSTTGSLEGLNYITNKVNVPLSEQQLVDCQHGSLIPFYLPCMGCSGGNMGFAFSYVSYKGLTTEAAYPYNAVGGTCNMTGKPIAFKNNSYHNVFPLCNSCLRKRVKIQPTSVAVDGSAIQLYKGGIFNGSCSIMTNHGVLAVGFDTDASQGDFWKIKNSWGPSWGENGFYRMERTESFTTGKCGIATRASYPTA